MLKKRSDECLFCGSRRCHFRIHSAGFEYDEVACPRHAGDLCRDADRRGPGVSKAHVSSTRILRRHREIVRRPRTRVECVSLLSGVPAEKVRAYLFGVEDEYTSLSEASRIADAIKHWRDGRAASPREDVGVNG